MRRSRQRGPLSLWLIFASSLDLTPFRNAEETFWTSANSAGVSPQQLGYSYPEFNGLDLGDREAVKDSISRIVDELYNGSSSGRPIFAPAANVAVTAREKEAPVHIDSVASTKPAALASAQTLGPRGIAAQDDQPQPKVTFGGMPTSSIAGGYRDWTACVQVKKYEIGGSFSVLLFLGTVPANLTVWHQSTRYAGAHHAFVNSTPERCANCRRQGDMVIEGFVHLNEAIARLSRLNSFDPTAVKPYLQENLQWRVLKVSACMPIDAELDVDFAIGGRNRSSSG